MEMKTTRFADLSLSRELQQALREADHDTPTPIQSAAVPVILEGRDLLGCAQTGTGKTAAFALPLLEQLHRSGRKPAPKAPLALVLVPTRELAAQVMESFRRYGKHVKVWQTTVFGGVNQNPQVAALRRGVHVLVATPGRLIDLMQQGHVRLDQVQALILDEADRMLDMGFLPPLKRIIAQLPEQRQSLCFSATMPPEVENLLATVLDDPHRIDIAPQSTATVQVEQQALRVEQSGKRDLLHEILSAPDAHRVLVFTRTKRRADTVAKQLRQGGIEADAIHGDKSQNARTRSLERFKRGKTHALVATDVAARGIHVENVSHVINYDVPNEPESYVHRIGRTGRASAVGKAVTFCDPGEQKLLRAIERLIGIDLLPSDYRRAERRCPGGKRPGHRRPEGNRTRRPSRSRSVQSRSREQYRPGQRKTAASSESSDGAHTQTKSREQSLPQRRKRPAATKDAKVSVEHAKRPARPIRSASVQGGETGTSTTTGQRESQSTERSRKRPTGNKRSAQGQRRKQREDQQSAKPEGRSKRPQSAKPRRTTKGKAATKSNGNAHIATGSDEHRNGITAAAKRRHRRRARRAASAQ